MIDEDQGLDLQRSLSEGLRRANDVEEMISEIKSVLVELDETVKQGTGDVVRVSLDNPRRTAVGQYRDVLEFFLELRSSHVDPEDREVSEFEVLARIIPTENLEDTRKLCGLTWSESGYPVTVDSGTHIDGCYDVTALRKSLAQVLGRATTGRKLRALIQRHQERQASLKAEGSPPGELGLGGGAAGADDSQE